MKGEHGWSNNTNKKYKMACSWEIQSYNQKKEEHKGSLNKLWEKGYKKPGK